MFFSVACCVNDFAGNFDVGRLAKNGYDSRPVREPINSCNLANTLTSNTRAMKKQTKHRRLITRPGSCARRTRRSPSRQLRCDFRQCIAKTAMPKMQPFLDPLNCRQAKADCLQHPRRSSASFNPGSNPSQQKKSAAAQLEKSNYQNETKRPLVCLAFVFPLILAYELGTLMLGRQAFRSGVDQWLAQLLNHIGFGQLVLLPVVTAGIMIIWHHRIEDHWRIRWPVLTGMILETAGLGLMLFLGRQRFSFDLTIGFGCGDPRVSTVTISPDRWWPTTMAYIGSGIYEELFFRLILLVPAIYWAHQVDQPQIWCRRRNYSRQSRFRSATLRSHQSGRHSVRTVQFLFSFCCQHCFLCFVFISRIWNCSWHSRCV